MLCERCNHNEATVHLTQVVDGNVKKLHLCEECANDSGFDLQGPVSITDILLGVGGGGDVEETEEVDLAADTICPTCHMTRADFKKNGRLGCPDCYAAFAEELASLLKAVHRSEQHTGKIPAREGDWVRLDARVVALQKELDQAVASEQYEKAAELRDEIRQLRDREQSEKQDPA